MDDFHIAETDRSPLVKLLGGNELIIEGKSQMEDASRFYGPVHEAVNAAIGQSSSLSVLLDLTYFNSSSAKQLLKLLMILDEADIQASVTWLYPRGNDLLRERGEEFEIMVDLPFEFQSKSL